MEAVRKYKAYDKYRDSGVDWLGEVPEHWKILKLKWITRLAYGHSLEASARVEDIVPVYGSNGIVGYHNECITNAPTVIIGRKGSYGKVTYSEKECFPIDTTYFIDKRFTNNNLRWIYYLLNILSLDKCSQDTGVPGLSRDYAYNQLCPLPYTKEQQKIAAFLDRETSKLDLLVEKKERLIELLKEKRQAIITQAVTKGLDPNVPMKDSGVEWLGKVPKHWDISKVKYYYDVCLGKMIQPSPNTENDTLEKYLCSLNVKWDGIDVTNIKEMWFSEFDKNKYALKKGDLIVCEGGDAGRAGIWKGEIENCYIQNAVHRVRGKENNLNKYLYYWLYYLKNIGYIDLICNKATIMHFTEDKLNNLLLVIPNELEQKRIVLYLDKTYAKIEYLILTIEKQIEKLKEYRQALISAAVTGKIDVRDEV